MQVIVAADEVIDSIDTEELAKFFAFKSDPEDEEAEVCFRHSTLLVFFLCDLYHLIQKLFCCCRRRRRWRRPVIN